MQPSSLDHRSGFDLIESAAIKSLGCVDAAKNGTEGCCFVKVLRGPPTSNTESRCWNRPALDSGGSGVSPATSSTCRHWTDDVHVQDGNLGKITLPPSLPRPTGGRRPTQHCRDGATAGIVPELVGEHNDPHRHSYQHPTLSFPWHDICDNDRWNNVQQHIARART